MIRELVERILEDIQFKNVCSQGIIAIDGISKQELEIILGTLNKSTLLSKAAETWKYTKVKYQLTYPYLLD